MKKRRGGGGYLQEGGGGPGNRDFYRVKKNILFNVLISNLEHILSESEGRKHIFSLIQELLTHYISMPIIFFFKFLYEISMRDSL